MGVVLHDERGAFNWVVVNMSELKMLHHLETRDRRRLREIRAKKPLDKGPQRAHQHVDPPVINKRRQRNVRCSATSVAAGSRRCVAPCQSCSCTEVLDCTCGVSVEVGYDEVTSVKKQRFVTIWPGNALRYTTYLGSEHRQMWSVAQRKDSVPAGRHALDGLVNPLYRLREPLML